MEELAKDPQFNFHIGIGLPENEIFPTLSYSDFFRLHSSNTLNWLSIARFIYDKYIALEKEKFPTATKFITSLKKHALNAGGEKSVLLFPGRWEGFGLKAAQELAQKILSSSNFHVVVAVRAHPLSTPENVHEMNPQFSGNSSLSDVEERIFYNSPVGMGEEIFGEVCYNFAHNLKKMIFLKIKKVVQGPPLYSSSMLQPFSVYTPALYKPVAPSPTGSEVPDDFFLASFSRGDKKVLDALSRAKVHKSLITDHDRIWSNFATFQLYSPEENLSKDFVQNLIYSSGPTPSDEKFSDPCVGKYFCEASVATQECDSENRIRIVKLGDTKSYKNLDQRAAPLSILQRLLLVDQVLPLSNFYFKIQKRVGVTDDFFLGQVKKFNEKSGEKLFHSFFNGAQTTLFSPPPLPPPPPLFFSQVPHPCPSTPPYSLGVGFGKPSSPVKTTRCRTVGYERKSRMGTR